MKNRMPRSPRKLRAGSRTVLGPRVLLCVVALLSAPVLVLAQRDSSSAAVAPGLTLRDAVDSALRHNPDLRIARSGADSARAELRLARAFANPAFTSIPGTPTQYAASIPLDIGPRRSFRVSASRLGAEATEQDARDSTRHLILAVRRAFYDVLLADARRTIVDERRTVVQQLVSADSVRVRAGDLPERALIRGEVELVRTEADVARAAVDAQTTRLELETLMGIPAPDTALRVRGDMRYRGVSIDEQTAVQTAMAIRPDMAASRRREDQSRALRHLAGASAFPVPLLSYVRQLNTPFPSGRYGALGIGVEVPLLTQYRGLRDRAEAGEVSARAARLRVEAQVTTDVRSAIAEFRAEQALVQRYEGGVLAKVTRNVEATRYAYSRGATSLLDVLDALRAEQDVLTDYSKALHDYWIATYSVDAAEGGGQD